MAGKGDRNRTKDYNKFRDNHDKIFNKNKDKKIDDKPSIKNNIKIEYDPRPIRCTKPLRARESLIKKHTEVDGDYWYILNNGKLCHQDKILNILK